MFPVIKKGGGTQHIILAKKVGFNMVRDMWLQIQGSDPPEYLGKGTIAITQGTESTNKHMKSDQHHTNRKKDELWPSVGETSRVVSFIGEFLYPQRLYMSKAHQLPQSQFRVEDTIKYAEMKKEKEEGRKQEGRPGKIQDG